MSQKHQISPNIQFLLSAGQQAPSADNSQPWNFRLSNSEILVEYAKERVGGQTFSPHDPATLLAIGGVLENLIQAAYFCSLECTWTLFPNGHEGAYFSFTLPKSDNSIANNETKASLSNIRRTNRFPFQSRPIPMEFIAAVANMQEGNALTKLFNTPSEIKAIASTAKQASEVRFQTQEVHEWLAKSLRFTKQDVSRGDGLDLATIALPPGGGMFMRFIMNWKWMSRLNRLGMYKLMAAIDVQLLKKAPAIIALVGGSSDEDIIAAGRLLIRVWTYLNSKGIAVHPYYVVSDQLQRQLDGKVPIHLTRQIGAVTDATARLLKLSEHQRLHMLLRVGYPTKEPARSKRLPLDTVCHEASSL